MAVHLSLRDVLWLTSSLSTASQTWMHRMIEMCEERVTEICVTSARKGHWRERIPVTSLSVGHTRLARAALRFSQVPIQERMRRRLAHRLARTGAQTVFAHFLHVAAQFEDVFDAAGVRVICHCHGFDVTSDLVHADAPSRRFHPENYTETMKRLGTKWTLVVNSEFTRAGLVALGVPNDRIVVKYFGYESRQTASAAFSHNPNILFLGRLVDFKGPDLTIKAFERACALGMRGRLTIAGDGPLRAMCELMRARSPVADRIRLLGEVTEDEGRRLRAQSQVFTAHSMKGSVTGQSEAFGVAFLEAIADGLPVVTGRSGGVPEIIVDGQTGILFEPGNIEAHARALMSVSEDPVVFAQMGQAGMKRARRVFSPAQERDCLHAILSRSFSPVRRNEIQNAD